MAQRPCHAAQLPRDYPISLRQSALAVFGMAYAEAEAEAEREQSVERDAMAMPDSVASRS
ncbi:MAG: hypothetical protein ABW048_04775 [Sphingobium sp.]